MIVIGLTGSIGMGKSTVTRQFAALGAKTCNADAIVHRLLAYGGAAVSAVKAAFPSVVKEGTVDRKALGSIVFSDANQLRTLEKILHPLVVREERLFVRNAKQKGARLCVMDIPLLFETGAQKRCDQVVVVSAPPMIQRQRVLRRPGMSPKRLHDILSRQMPDRQKRRRADKVIHTGIGMAYSFRQLKAWVQQLENDE